MYVISQGIWSFHYFNKKIFQYQNKAKDFDIFVSLRDIHARRLNVSDVTLNVNVHIDTHVHLTAEISQTNLLNVNVDFITTTMHSECFSGCRATAVPTKCLLRGMSMAFM